MYLRTLSSLGTPPGLCEGFETPILGVPLTVLVDSERKYALVKQAMTEKANDVPKSVALSLPLK